MEHAGALKGALSLVALLGLAPATWADAPALENAMKLPGWVRGLVGARASLVDLASDIERTIPPRGSGAYTPPTDKQLATFRGLFTALARGDLAGGAHLAAQVHYRVTPFTDAATGTPLVLVVEKRPWRHRFGFFALDLAPAAADLVIEVPHPKHDMHTGRLGAYLFSRAGLRPFALVMATAHRYDSGVRGESPTPADPTRYASSVFEVAHEVLTTAGRRRYAVQVHGYAYSAQKHSDSSAVPVDAVLSQGAGGDGAIVDPLPDGMATQLSQALHQAGLTTSLADSTGRWWPLCASRNPQGHFTNSPEGAGPGWFIHVEFERSVREGAAADDPDLLRGLRQALDAVPWREGKHPT